ncbi:acyl- synthetase family member mitochondrial-like [Brachionus plicatilis]|uniref:Medium-chain acyl-CoA ligase ACSF2, mitochondrial n=1 Tax=Brachionus plicatilis TaxID=10195 RepID=A0A3M7P2Y8_BRAPC|nr:acyl- synthetase family member mitochondrial-like [Brachionus plicatilis]
MHQKILNIRQFFNFKTIGRYVHHNHNHYKLSYVSSINKIPFLDQTTSQRIDYAAEKYTEKDSFVFHETGDRWNFVTLKKKIDDLATGLLALGLEKGDRVAIWAPNCAEWILTQYATASAGFIMVNINPSFKALELEYALKKVNCKAIILSENFKNQDYVEILVSICPEISSSNGIINSKTLPDLKSAILISDQKKKGFYSFNQVANGGETEQIIKLEGIKKKCQFSDPINIQFTSGTTGSPKAVTLSHHMLLNNSYFVGLTQEYHKHPTRICLQVPLFHCFGMVFGSLSSIIHGSTCVIPSRTFNPEKSLEAISIEKCTNIYGTPTMFIDLYTNRNLAKYDLSSVHGGIMAGSVCPLDVVDNCIKKLNTKNICVIYGMTETSPAITVSSIKDSLKHRTQSIGRTKEHLEVKIVDSEGKIVPVNEPGELLVRGYNTMIGYWGEKEKTEEIYTSDRFLRTGDIVRMDEDGFFYHQGRLKDMVIRGGENIYPKEIEEFLHQNEKVDDVYVVGIPDKRLGEELCACIRVKSGETLTPDEIKLFCKDKISNFKIPKYVEFMDDFPQTVSGKIKKNVLKEQIIKKMGL